MDLFKHCTGSWLTCQKCNSVFKQRAPIKRKTREKYGVFCEDCKFFRPCKKCNKVFDVRTVSTMNNRNASLYCGDCKKPKKCEFCGVIFQPKNNYGFLYQKTCSKQCGVNLNKKPLLRPCDFCGGKINRPASHIKRPDRDDVEKNNVFCSRKCYNTWQSDHKKTKVLPSERYGHRGKWEAQRNKVRMRDNNTCQLCQRKKKWRERHFHVHHIIPALSFSNKDDANVLANLILLCGSCHIKVEKGKIPCPQPKN